MSLAVLVNKCLVIPLLSYYGDFGACVPYELPQNPMQVPTELPNIYPSYHNDEKSKRGRILKSHRATGHFPQISTRVIFQIFLPDEKLTLRANLVGDTISSG